MSTGGNLNAGTNTADKTAATQILLGRSQRDDVVITNSGAANNVYVGSSTVTTSLGYKLIPGATVHMVGYLGPVYVIADNATASVSWLETY